MIAKIEKISKTKRVRPLAIRKHTTMKGLYYRELIKRMFSDSNKININENEPIKESSDNEKHLLNKYV